MEDISEFIRDKLALCACHATQADKPVYLDPEGIQASARSYYLSGFGRPGGFAEAFRIHVYRSSTT